ncbi:MAG: LysR family transcriptional regulator substrate-binding protein [Firmicutes bacterium]|nr:LysR family transcriptional regulator substrate-binding protein [Bacillota bacterium]
MEIAEGTSTELLQAMQNLEVDLCIISERKGAADWIPLAEDELLACLPLQHPRAGGRQKAGDTGTAARFPVTAFAEEDFIELYPGKETDNSRMFQRCGVRPRMRYSTSDNYAAYAMVAAGLGITCTNAIIGEAFTEGVVYQPLDPPQKVEIGLVLPAPKDMSPAARRFAEFAKDRFR